VGSGRVARMDTFHPACSRPSVMPSPIPRFPPVTRATFSAAVFSIPAILPQPSRAAQVRAFPQGGSGTDRERFPQMLAATNDGQDVSEDRVPVVDDLLPGHSDPFVAE